MKFVEDVDLASIIYTNRILEGNPKNEAWQAEWQTKPGSKKNERSYYTSIHCTSAPVHPRHKLLQDPRFLLNFCISGLFYVDQIICTMITRIYKIQQKSGILLYIYCNIIADTIRTLVGGVQYIGLFRERCNDHCDTMIQIVLRRRRILFLLETTREEETPRTNNSKRHALPQPQLIRLPP